MLAPLFFGHLGDGNAILQKMIANRRDEHVIHVLADASVGAQKVTGEFWIDRKRQLANISLTGGPEKYQYTQNAKSIIEYSTGSENYDRWDYRPAFSFRFFASKVSNLPAAAFPSILIADLGRYVTKPQQTKDERGDRIDWNISTPSGIMKLAVVTDRAGRPIWFMQIAPDGVRRDWTMRYEAISGTVPDSKWVTPIPAGMSSYSIPLPAAPLEPGNPFPTKGWMTASNRKPFDLTAAIGSKTGIVAILGDDAPSKNSMSSLEKLRKSGIPVVIVLAEGANPIPGALTDSTGKRGSQLAGGTTPTFFFVDKSGSLAITMMGFDVSKRAKFEAEAIQHANGK